MALLNTNQFAELTAAITRAVPRDMDPTTAQQWIEEPDALAKILRSALCPPSVPKEFPIWKQIKLGTHKDAAALIKSLEKGDFRIYDWARDIMSKSAFTVASEEIAVDLVVVSVGELGFKRGATYAKIIERAQAAGLKLCEAEVGPQLRLQYPDQEVGEWLGIGMECISDSRGRPGFFAVVHGGGGRWLSTDYDHDSTWNAGYRFVFRK